MAYDYEIDETIEREPIDRFAFTGGSQGDEPSTAYAGASGNECQEG